MPEVISSVSQASGRGVFIIFKAVLDAVLAVGTGRAAMIAQLPWGPIDTETPFQDAATFRDLFAPAGFPRTSQGYLMATKFPWIDLQIIRVLGTTPVKATFTIQNVTPANCLKVDGKYYGAQGNGIQVLIANATSGTGTSFDMTVSITDAATGLVTSEFYQDVDSTQVADDATHTYWAGLGASSKLVAFTKAGTGRPVNGTYTLASGSDGAAIASGNYLGTPGSADKGLALLELDADVSFIFTDDPGSTPLSAVMAGIKAHCVLMKDRRIGVLMGLPAETSTTAKTNAATNAYDHCVYVWPHGKVLDDQGNKTVIPLSGPLASFATLLTPHLSIAYKSKAFTKALANLIELDASATKATKIDLEKNGVVPFEKSSKTGWFSPYCDVTTSKTSAVFGVRMADYIAFSIADTLEEFRGAPNDDETFEDERTLIDDFGLQLVANRKRDHIFLPCINAWQLLPTEANNTAATIAAGDATHGIRATLISEQKRIFLVGEIGTTVKITASTSA